MNKFSCWRAVGPTRYQHIARPCPLAYGLNLFGSLGAERLEVNVSDFWGLFNRISQEIDSGRPNEALALIDQNEKTLSQDVGLAATLKSRSYLRLGRAQDAYDLLRPLAQTDGVNQWVYHSFGSLATGLGHADEAAVAYRKFHGTLGWHQSVKNEYFFTHDYFSGNISNWSRWFASEITQSPIQCMEIGSWQGGSSTWLLDNIVSQRTKSSLTCIDAFEGSSEHSSFIKQIDIEDIFNDNIRRTGYGHLVTKLKGFSQDVLRGLTASYDFIYVDGAHEAKFVIQDAFLSWRLLNKGGYMLFDDYPFSFGENSPQNTAVAVDQFIAWHQDELRVVERGRQVLVQRL